MIVYLLPSKIQTRYCIASDSPRLAKWRPFLFVHVKRIPASRSAWQVRFGIDWEAA